MTASDNLHPSEFSFYRGTVSPRKPGDIIPARGLTHFSSSVNTAVTFGHINAVEKSATTKHVYQVKPTGPYEVDPKMPSRTSSFRSGSGLEVIGEVPVGSHSAVRSRKEHKGF